MYKRGCRFQELGFRIYRPSKNLAVFFEPRGRLTFGKTRVRKNTQVTQITTDVHSSPLEYYMYMNRVRERNRCAALKFSYLAYVGVFLRGKNIALWLATRRIESSSVRRFCIRWHILSRARPLSQEQKSPCR